MLSAPTLSTDALSLSALKVGPHALALLGTSCIKVNKAIFGSSSNHLNHSEGDPIDPKGIVQKRAQEDRGRICGLKQQVMERIPPNENAGKSRDRHMKRGCAACQVNLYMRSNCWSKSHKA